MSFIVGWALIAATGAGRARVPPRLGPIAHPRDHPATVTLRKSQSIVPWNYVPLGQDEGGAKCLDGSPYGFYLRVGADPTRWVVELAGGGWCYDGGLCWERGEEKGTGSKGSSMGWALNMTDFAGWGPSNIDPEANPLFWNATHVYLDYCDGGSFSGYRAEPWSVGRQPYGPDPSKLTPPNASVWFRGAANLEASLSRMLTQFGLATATELLLHGGSAGGLSTLLHLDRTQRIVGPTVRVVGLSNAGFFKPVADHPAQYPYDPSANFTAQIEHTFAMQNATGSLSHECLAAQPPGLEYRCMLAPWAEPHVVAPLFVLQSKFDHFQLDAELGLRCMAPQCGGQPYSPPWAPAAGPGGANCTPADIAAIAAYGGSYWGWIAPTVARSAARRGVFLTSCIIHGQTAPAAWSVTTVDGDTPSSAFAGWWTGSAASATRDGKWVENCSMPCNPNAAACAPWH